MIVVGTTVETIRKRSSKALPTTVSDARPVAVAVLSRLTASPFGSALAFRVTLVLLAKVSDSNAPVPRSEIVSCPTVAAFSSPIREPVETLKVKFVTGTVSMTGSTLA